jgi:hypothetical protein
MPRARNKIEQSIILNINERMTKSIFKVFSQEKKAGKKQTWQAYE